MAENKFSVWLGVAASGITVLAFFGITNFDQLRGGSDQAQKGDTDSAGGNGPFTNISTGLCIDTDGPQGPGVELQVRGCANYTGQSWTYDKDDQHFANPPSGLCLDTAGPPGKGVRLVVNPCGNDTGQVWQHNAGTGQLVNQTTGLCMDAAGPPAAFVALVLNPCGNYTGQLWRR